MTRTTTMLMLVAALAATPALANDPAVNVEMELVEADGTLWAYTTVTVLFGELTGQLEWRIDGQVVGTRSFHTTGVYRYSEYMGTADQTVNGQVDLLGTLRIFGDQGRDVEELASDTWELPKPDSDQPGFLLVVDDGPSRALPTAYQPIRYRGVGLGPLAL